MVGAASWHDQHDFDVRFDWGPPAAGAPGASVVVVVDVLRWSTAVEAATARGLRVFPCRWEEPGAARLAASVGAVLADGSAPGRASLSPLSFAGLPAGSSVVLPSPNGSTCALLAAETGAAVMAGCLRNAQAVADRAAATGSPVRVVACGERWPDGSLRPAIEDLLGAGAIIRALPGTRSPEADAAAAAFDLAAPRLADVLAGCASGREAIERGWESDLAYAGVLNCSTTVPVLARSIGDDVAAFCDLPFERGSER